MAGRACQAGRQARQPTACSCPCQTVSPCEWQGDIHRAAGVPARCPAGVPPVLERFMSLVPALHEVAIFLTGQRQVATASGDAS